MRASEGTQSIVQGQWVTRRPHAFEMPHLLTCWWKRHQRRHRMLGGTVSLQSCPLRNPCPSQIGSSSQKSHRLPKQCQQLGNKCSISCSNHNSIQGHWGHRCGYSVISLWASQREREDIACLAGRRLDVNLRDMSTRAGSACSGCLVLNESFHFPKNPFSHLESEGLRKMICDVFDVCPLPCIVPEAQWDTQTSPKQPKEPKKS